MQRIAYSPRLHHIEHQWKKPIAELLSEWHWQENLKHSEIGKRIGVPRGTITRWFHQLGIPSQSCTRFTNLNLKRWPPAKQKPKKEFPWKVNQSFFTKWSEEMAYILGFIVADGAVFTNPRGSQYLAFYSTDREIIEKIRFVMQSNHTIGARLRPYPEKTLYVLQIGSKTFVSKLKKFGIIQNKSLVIRMPKDVPEKHLGHFIRGYFDGDGCIYFRKHQSKDRSNPRWVLMLRFTSGSKKLLLDIQHRLAKYTSGGFITNNGAHWDLVYSHRDCRIIGKLLYRRMQSNLFLARKHKTYQEILSWAGRGVGRPRLPVTE